MLQANVCDGQDGNRQYGRRWSERGGFFSNMLPHLQRVILDFLAIWFGYYTSPSLYKINYIFLNRVARSTGCSLNIVFFSKNSRKFATSPSPALGCYWLYKNYQPIGVAVHSHCVRALKVSYSDVGKGGVAENCEKTTFSLNTL